MPRFLVEMYELHAVTYEVEAETVQEAIMMSGTCQVVQDDFIDNVDENGMDRNDYDDPKMLALFENDENAIIPALRSIENTETGEIWHKFAGYTTSNN